MKIKVLNLDGSAAKGEVELSDVVFGIEPRADILHRVVTWQLENRRGTARGARERSDVARTGKKFGMALSAKAKDGLVIVDSLDVKDAKTKALSAQLAKANWGKKVLVMDGDAVNETFALASRNIVGVQAMSAAGANVYDILKHDTLVLTRAAVEKLEARFNG